MTTTKGSGEIVSTARVKVPPKNRRELWLTISSLLDRIRREEGCKGYGFYGEAEDQNSFLLIGEWETQEAWDQHLASNNFAILLGSIRLLSNRAVDFKLLSHAAAIEEETRARCEPAEDTQAAISIN